MTRLRDLPASFQDSSDLIDRSIEVVIDNHGVELRRECLLGFGFGEPELQIGRIGLRIALEQALTLH